MRKALVYLVPHIIIVAINLTLFWAFKKLGLPGDVAVLLVVTNQVANMAHHIYRLRESNNITVELLATLFGKGGK